MRYRAQHLIDSDTLRMMNIELDKFKEINKHQLIKNLADEMLKNINVNIVDVKEPIHGLQSEIDIYVISDKQFDNMIRKMFDAIHENNPDVRGTIMNGIVEMIRNK